MENSEARMAPLRCPQLGQEGWAFILLWMSHWMGAATPRRHDLGWGSFLSLDTPQRGLTAEGLPAAFLSCRGINLHAGKETRGAHHWVHHEQPSLSSTCVWDLPLPFTYLYKKHFPPLRTYFLYPHSHPTLATLVHRVNAESQILFVLKCILSSLPPSFSPFLTSLHQLSSGRFTCFQFEPRDSQPRQQAKCQLIPSSLEFFHYFLSGHIFPSLPSANTLCMNAQGSSAADRMLEWSLG